MEKENNSTSRNMQEPTQESAAPLKVIEVLTRYYGKDFRNTLEEYIRDNREKIIDAGMPDAEDIHVLRVQYEGTTAEWGQPESDTETDIDLLVALMGTTAGKTVTRTVRFTLRYTFDLRPCHRSVSGPQVLCGKEREKPLYDRYIFSLDEYLIPVIRKDQYEILAGWFVREYYPGLFTAFGRHDISPETVAERMGLKIRDVRFQDPTIMGQLYYDEGKVWILSAAGNPRRETIKPGTILISKDNCQTEGTRNSTIMHECCHMFLDKWFFLLQGMTGKLTVAFTSRRTVRAVGENTALDWMEYQCEKLPSFILANPRDTRYYFDTLMRKRSNLPKPDAIRMAIDDISTRFRITKSMAKKRLIELGIDSANGVYCYAGNERITDHCCSGKWPEGITFTVSAEAASKLMFEDQALNRMVWNGLYVYTDGHFCRNSGKYVYCSRDGRYTLNLYARTHIEECCIPFRTNTGDRINSYFPTHVSRKITKPVTRHYLPKYTLEAESGSPSYSKENESYAADVLLWGQLMKELPRDFREAVLLVMQKKGITQERLTELIGTHRKAVHRILTADKPEIEGVVSICIALSIPYALSAKLIELSGNAFTYKDQHVMYQSFLMRPGEITIERCNDILTSMNLPPLIKNADK